MWVGMPIRRMAHGHMPKANSRGVDADRLRALQQKGATHPLITCRLDFSEPAQLLKSFIQPLIGKERIHPRMLPTQASGRWSTTEPPRVNFPPDCINPDCPAGEHEYTDQCWSARDCVGPDPDTYWVTYDYDAIEAKLSAAYANDLAELEAFAQGYDLHTLTACDMFGLPQPSLRTKALHTSPECAAWRTKVEWGGTEDRRRHIAKMMRYALQNGTNEFAALSARGIEKLNLSRNELLRFARQYLAEKPLLTRAKKACWQQVVETGEARTFLGRRRRFFLRGEDYVRWRDEGKPCGAQREGWAHQISGSVSDVMNLTLIALSQEFREMTLGLNKHDGAELIFPEHLVVGPEEVMPNLRAIVEKTWNVNGHPIRFSADFATVWPGGRKYKVK